MARAQAQKAAAHPENTEQLSPETQAEIAEIEARRAKLREIGQGGPPQTKTPLIARTTRPTSSSPPASAA